MRVLVCGSRSYGRERLQDGTLGAEEPTLGWVFPMLDRLYSAWVRGLVGDGPFVVIEGGARGADRHARMWCAHADEVGRSVTHMPYEAQWEQFGRAAGPIRNEKQLNEGRPTHVLAFVDKPLVDSKGTSHMVSIARGRGVHVTVMEEYKREGLAR